LSVAAGVPPANPLTAAGTAASTAVALLSDLLSGIEELNIFCLTDSEIFADPLLTLIFQHRI
jgi:hypothetical protein